MAKKTVKKKVTKKTKTATKPKRKTTAASKAKVAKRPARKAKKKTSTVGRRTPRIAATTADPVEDPASIEVAPAPAPTPKTKLSPDDLAEFKRMLLDKRAEIVGDVKHLQEGALTNGTQAGNLSSVPVHMADISTDRWEQEFNIHLMENEQSLLKEIDAALERIDQRVYGVCEHTGKMIRKRRLRAKPWARYCIEYARERELGR